MLNDNLTGMSCDDDVEYTVQENLKAESSEKIKRALRHNVLSYNNMYNSNMVRKFIIKEKRHDGPDQLM